jgi:glyoxylase-like metal-dependent hydrolase (beta-lactamase superfamily II)
MSLKFRVFLHSYLGFNSNSTLIYGERDAILIDAFQRLSDTHRMVAEIILMRKNLTHIYVSHFHPDHHFGLQVLKNAFPEARIVALPSVVKDIVSTSSDKIELWAIDRFGPDDIPRKTTIPMPLDEPCLLLEGEEILVSDNWEGVTASITPWSGSHRSESLALPTWPSMTAIYGRSKAMLRGGSSGAPQLRN